jgi:hypothetical protein
LRRKTAQIRSRSLATLQRSGTRRLVAVGDLSPLYDHVLTLSPTASVYRFLQRIAGAWIAARTLSTPYTFDGTASTLLHR